MRYQNFREYALGISKIGIGLGVISILGRWVTGNTFLAAPESLVKYGIFAGIGYALMGCIALIAFGWIGAKVRKELPEGQTIGDFLQYKLTPVGYWLFMFMILFTCLNGMYMQGTAASLLLHLLFNIPISIGLLCFFTLCVLLAGFGGIHFIHRFAIFQVICIFATIILIPVYFFIQEGIKPVYEGIRLYHPYMLVLNNYDSFNFMITSILIGVGQIFSDMASWQRVYMIEKKKIVPTFILSGLIWATIPLAISSLFMVVIFSGGVQQRLLFTD